MALTKEEKEKLRLQAEVNARRNLYGRNLYGNAITQSENRARSGVYGMLGGPQPQIVYPANPNEGFLGPNNTQFDGSAIALDALTNIPERSVPIFDPRVGPSSPLPPSSNDNLEGLFSILADKPTVVINEARGEPDNPYREDRFMDQTGQSINPINPITPDRVDRFSDQTEQSLPLVNSNVAPIEQRAMAPSIVSRSIAAEEEKYGPGGKFSATPLPGGIYDRSGTGVTDLSFSREFDPTLVDAPRSSGSGTGVTNLSMSQNPVFTRGNESTNISPTNIFSVDNERKKIDQRARLLSGMAAVFGGNPRAADIYRKNRSAVIDQLATRQAILGGPEDGYLNKGAAFRYLVAQGLPIDDATKYAEFLVNKPIDTSTRKKDRTQLTQSLRKEYIGESKEYKSKVNSFRTSLSAAKQKTGPGDVALVFNFMKTLDPRSTVREGEFAQASQAGGIEQTFLNAYNKAREGVLLTDKVRNLLMDTIKDDFRQAYASQNIIKNNYREIASDAELNENLVVTELVPIVEKDGDSFFKIGTILVPIVDQLNEIERQELKLLRRKEALSLIDKDSRYKENNQGN